MFFQEVAPGDAIALSDVRIVRKLLSEVLSCHEKCGYEWNHNQRQPGTQREHSCQSKAGCQHRSQDSGNEIRRKIRYFFDRFSERIDNCTYWSLVVVVSRQRVKVPQQLHSQVEGH